MAQAPFRNQPLLTPPELRARLPEFYRALGGTASEVAFFVFGDDP